MDLENQRQLIRNRVFNPTEFDIVRESYHYVIFCANIKKFFPHFPSEKYREFYQKKYYYQYTSAYEQDSLAYLERTKIINESSFDFKNPNKETNYIFGAFHLGSYRTVVTYLCEQGLKIVLIIDESVFLEQLDSFLHTVKNVLSNDKNSDLIILNVNDRTSIFKLKQLVSQGYTMAVYLDGNTSINSKAQDFSKGYIPISFFGQEIFVKNGVAKLATILNAKIIPSISHRDDYEENTITFYKEISINDFSDKQEFLVKSIENCYKHLENQISIYPYQWECWSYIHKWFPRNQISNYYVSPESISKFNTERYDLYEVNGKHFIFDLLSYQSYPISNEVKQLIVSEKFQDINSSLLTALKNKNILI